MKQIVVAALVLACFLVVAGCMPERDMQYSRRQSADSDTVALMTQKDVIAMTKAGVGDDVIIDMMHNSDSYFRLSPNDVVALADSGVSDKVISAMIRTSQGSQQNNGRYARYYYDPGYYWGSPYAYYYYPWYAGLSFAYYGRPFYYGYGHRAFFPHYGTHMVAPSGHAGFGGGGGARGGTRSGGRHR